MTDPTAPNLTRYRQLHNAMRIADDRLVTGIDTLAEGERDRAGALHEWFVGYAGELRAHHKIEDHIVFPALAARVPEYERYAPALAGDHEHLDELLDRIESSLSALATLVDGWQAERTLAVALATELRDLLAGHLDVEDDEVLPMIERHFSAADWKVLDDAALKHMTVKQLRFTLPWWMATVPADVAAHELAVAPLLLKVIWRLTRRRYARLEAKAFGSARALQAA